MGRAWDLQTSIFQETTNYDRLIRGLYSLNPLTAAFGLHQKYYTALTESRALKETEPLLPWFATRLLAGVSQWCEFHRALECDIEPKGWMINVLSPVQTGNACWSNIVLWETKHFPVWTPCLIVCDKIWTPMSTEHLIKHCSFNQFRYSVQHQQLSLVTRQCLN